MSAGTYFRFLFMSLPGKGLFPDKYARNDPRFYNTEFLSCKCRVKEGRGIIFLLTGDKTRCMQKYFPVRYDSVCLSYRTVQSCHTEQGSTVIPNSVFPLYTTLLFTSIQGKLSETCGEGKGRREREREKARQTRQRRRCNKNVKCSLNKLPIVSLVSGKAIKEGKAIILYSI